MFVGIFLISLVFIGLLIALPFIFKSIFKTQNYMGYSIGLCASALTVAALIGVAFIGYIFFLAVLGISFSLNSLVTLAIGAILLYLAFILLIYTIIFLFIYFYTKGISNPNQPYNSVFMFIAGYLLPPFALIYLFFILVSFADQENSNYGTMRNVETGIVIIIEFFFLLYMIQIAGTIMLCMLHHRKVNQSILCILLVCYFLPAFTFLTGYFFRSLILSLIPNMVLGLASFGFGVFFYCKYANQDYPKSELLAPSDI